MEGRLAPVIFFAVLTVLCTLLLTCLMADPHQTLMDEQRTDEYWIIAVWNWIRRLNFLSSCRKNMRYSWIGG